MQPKIVEGGTIFMQETKDLLEPLRKQVYAKMKQRDWSLTHLAVVCGISSNTLRDIIAKKKNNIYFATIIKISEGINVPVSELIHNVNSGK